MREGRHVLILEWRDRTNREQNPEARVKHFHSFIDSDAEGSLKQSLTQPLQPPKLETDGAFQARTLEPEPSPRALFTVEGLSRVRNLKGRKIRY